MRQIVLELTEEFTNVNADNTMNVHGAIGYLASWAHTSEKYRNLKIFGDRRGDLHAVYRNVNGEVTYSILGQRGEDGTFSFHS